MSEDLRQEIHQTRQKLEELQLEVKQLRNSNRLKLFIGLALALSLPVFAASITGNFTVGSSNAPADTLDVYGDIRVRGADINDAGGTSRITITDNGSLLLKEDGGVSSFTIDTNGNILAANQFTSSGMLYANGGIDLVCTAVTLNYSLAVGAIENIEIAGGPGTDSAVKRYCGAGYEVLQSRCVSGGGTSTVTLHQAGSYNGDGICTYFNGTGASRTVYIEATCCRMSL